jgi:CRP/FNR family transcriptional regulator, cyclic AMP receptor protein
MSRVFSRSRSGVHHSGSGRPDQAMEPATITVDGAKTGFFGRLDGVIKKMLIEAGTFRRMDTGMTLALMGASNTPVNIIMHGAVKILAISSDGQESLCEIRGPGDIVGASEALDGGVRTTHAVMGSDGLVLVIPTRAFERLLQASPDLHAAVSLVIVERLRRLHEQRAQATLPADRRLAGLLHSLAIEHGSRSDDGTTITVDLSQNDLRSAIDVSVTTIERTLRKFRQAGIVKTGYRRVTIPDLDELRRTAEADTWAGSRS